jgi:ferredoxin-NADP reductase
MSTAVVPDLAVRLRTLRREALDVVSLELADPNGCLLPAWAPGAHVDLVLADNLRRQYSLCGDPSDRTFYRLAVLREGGGRGGSQHVHEQLRPGDLLAISPPRNHFPLVPSPRYVFVAGGIGITPIIPMIREVDARGAAWKLLYGGRTRASMAFTSELSEYGDRVVLVPEDESGRLPLAGWLCPRQPDTQVYCCGPEGLLQAVEEICRASSPTGCLHTERFASKPVDQTAVADDPAFQVVCQDSGIVVDVAGGISILEALRQAGLEVPSSCEEGVCGTCETDVIAGVPDHRDSILSDTEMLAGKSMFICVSRSRSSRLVLDI